MGEKDDDDLLIFLHADVQIERTFLSNAHEFFNESGFQVGFCRMDFGKSEWSFKFLCWIATFDSSVTSFGDQGILVRNEGRIERSEGSNRYRCVKMWNSFAIAENSSGRISFLDLVRLTSKIR